MGYKSRYDSADWLALCDDCGKKYKASQLRKRWDNLVVCEICYEERQPQDFVRGMVDKIAVPWSRPEPSDQFAAYCTCEGMSGVAGYSMAGCAVPGKPMLCPFPPQFCSVNGIFAQADYGTADCAQADIYERGLLP